MLDDADVFYYEAFQILTHSRQIGMGGALPIPLSEVEVLMRLYQIPTAERIGFVRIIRAIDLTYLELIEQRRTKGMPHGGIKT